MLKNKSRVFFVTGSSSGIGRCIADSLVSSGINVIYHGKSERKMDLPPKCEYVWGDLSSEQVVEGLHSYINEKYEVEGVVCCAGRTHISNLEDTPTLLKPDDLRVVLNNILFTTILTCQKFAPDLASKGNGRIIIIGGDVVDKPNQNGEMCAYALAKSAVHQYALYLSNSLRPNNISVNVVAPTGVFRQEEPTDSNKTMIRRATKQEVASFVKFLCLQQSFISGQVIRVNGGRSNYFDL